MAVELRTNVVIGGRTDSSFDALAAKLATLAAGIEALAQPLREYGEEALETYKDYETYMLEAKGAMSANYSSATKLEKDYAALQKQVQEWSASTIFHTDDYARAVSEAAHAGWDYAEMLEGIPQAALLAQAGNTSLSSGLDYLIKALNATGTAFGDASTLVDQWVMAANSAPTTVSELGEAMIKMGSTMRFADSNAELLALLDALAMAGTTGTEAGTLLRNTMLRLIAPTDKAGAAMKVLGASTEEIESLLSDATVTKAAKELEGLGFSAYTAQGELRPFVDTFSDLYDTLNGLTEQRQNELLSAIFPTRTITGARNILESIAFLKELQQSIEESEGYAERVAKTQTGGLMGAAELYASKWEEVSRRVGESISRPQELFYEWTGKIADTINGFDTVTLNTIVGGLTAIGAAGAGISGLATAAFALRHLGTGGVGLVLTAGAVGALVGHFSTLNQLALDNNFGEMYVNLQEIGTALGGISKDLGSQYASFASYGEAAKQAAADYAEAGTALAENLWTKMVTGTKVEKDSQEYKDLVAAGESMIDALRTGIAEASAAKIKLTDYLFDTNVFDESTKESDPLYASLMSLLTVGYDDAIALAESKSAELRSAMVSAFADGKLDEAELTGIQKIMSEMNELMAGVNGYDVNKYLAYERSQHISLEGAKEFTEEVNKSRENATQALRDEYDYLKAYTRAMYDWAADHGESIINPLTGEAVSAADVDIEYIMSALETKYAEKYAASTGAFDDYIINGWTNAFKTSGSSGIFQTAQELLGMYMSGMMDYRTAAKLINTSEDQAGRKQLGQALGSMIDLYGGTDAMADYIAKYRSAGGADNERRADWFEQALLMYGLFSNVDIPNTTSTIGSTRTGIENMRNALAEAYDPQGYYTDAMLAGVQKVYEGLTEEQKSAWNSQVEKLAQEYDLGAIINDVGGDALSAMYANWMGAYMVSNDKLVSPEDYKRTPGESPAPREESRTEEAQAAADNIGQQLAEYETKIENISNTPVELTVESNADEAAADITAAAAGPYEAYVSVIYNDPGFTPSGGGSVVVDVVYNDPGAPSGSGGGGSGGRYSALRNNAYAEGGRSDEPAIFGEDGPEWAIPEQHSERTAELLNAARQASGFTWNELIARFGGLGGRAEGVVVNIGSYAPVINATDATGVEKKLIEDKNRLKELVGDAVRDAMERKALHDAIEVYA